MVLAECPDVKALVDFHSSVSLGGPAPFVLAAPILLLPLGCSSRLALPAAHTQGVAQWVLSLSPGSAERQPQQPRGQGTSLKLEFNMLCLACFVTVLRSSSGTANKGYFVS